MLVLCKVATNLRAGELMTTPPLPTAKMDAQALTFMKGSTRLALVHGLSIMQRLHALMVILALQLL